MASYLDDASSYYSTQTQTIDGAINEFIDPTWNVEEQILVERDLIAQCEAHKEELRLEHEALKADINEEH